MSQLPHVLVVGGHEETFRMIADLPVRMTIFPNDRCFDDCEEVVARARAIHDTDPFVGAVSFTEYGLLPAAEVSARLGIRGNALGAVRLTRDKLAMRAALASAGLERVQFRQCDSEEDARAFLAALGRPIIMKPAKGSGSSGVFRVDSDADVAAAYARTRREHGGPTLVEELLFGTEYSVESMTTFGGGHTVIAVTEKITTGAPRFVELGHRMPAALPADVTAEIARYVCRFLDAVGHTFGPAHTEVMRTRHGLRIIEGNTRPGEDFIWELVLHAMGVDLVRDTVRALAEIPPPSHRPIAHGAGRVFFFALESCRVVAAEGFEQAREAPGVIRLHCSLSAGQELGAVRSSHDRQGFIVTVGGSLDEAEAHLEDALGHIVVVTTERLSGDALRLSA